MTELNHKTTKKFRITSLDEKDHICDVLFSFSHWTEGNIFLEGNINITTTFLNHENNIDFDWRNDAYPNNGFPRIIISDFILDPEIRRKGVGSFIWHQIFWGSPKI